MKIGLIDVDGHNFPNLALMRISAWHKAQGDEVEWWWSDFVHYDIVYMSKIFSDAYSPDIPEPMNADKVVKGGTGYCISLGEDGKEHFDQSKNTPLPPEVEAMFPDYSIYPQFDFAVGFTSRGCPRGCSFCHVQAKEGCVSRKCADVSSFWNGQPSIQAMDPNITACRDKHDLFMQYADTKALVDFNQGLDIRMITDRDIDDLNHIRLAKVHFAWDNPRDDLEKKFANYAKGARWKHKGSYGMVYCLTNFEDCSTKEHVERALYRVETLSSLGYDPYIMVYNKPAAPKVIRDLQRWCNNKIIFKSTSFEDYKAYSAGEIPGQISII